MSKLADILNALDNKIDRPSHLKKGRVVETKSGKIGITYNDDRTVMGKVLVYVVGGEKIVAAPSSLKIIGYVD